jgi:hypothetical protein
MCHPMGETSRNNSTTKSQKGIISYTLANGITIMKKHIVNEHLGKQPWQNLKGFLLEYQLTNKIISYVKGEGTNLSILDIALTNVIVSYAPL